MKLNLSEYNKRFILVDENSKNFCLPIFLKHFNLSAEDFFIIEIESGEENKNLDTYQKIISHLIENEADKSSLFINLGGGVICDMGGFAATTFKRGIDFINVPTTLLSMVDAAHGGKTAVNFNNIKNLVGIFAFPKDVIINTEFLRTLPKKEFQSGLGEIAKMCIISKNFDMLSNLSQVQNDEILKLINFSIDEKAKIVKKDPFDRGERRKLNFGHSFGHSFETVFLQKGEKIPHGLAVLLGMIEAIKISVKQCNFDKNLAEKIIFDLRNNFELPDISQFSQEEILHILKQDKKNQNGEINLVLLNDASEIVLEKLEIF